MVDTGYYGRMAEEQEKREEQRYHKCMAREEQRQQVASLLLVAGLSLTQIKPLSEMITSVFVEEVPES